MKKLIDKLKVKSEDESEIGLKEFVLIIVTALLGFSVFANIFYFFFQDGALTYVLSAMSCAITYRLIIKEKFWKIFKKLFNWRTWVLGLIFGIILTGFNFGATHLVSLIVDELGANESSVRNMLVEDKFWACIYIIMLAPFIEEFAYRYGVFGYAKKYKRIIAYIASGLIFGLIHLVSAITGDVNWLAEGLSLVVYSCCGLILCYAYDSTNSLMVSTIAHILSNVVAVLLLL